MAIPETAELIRERILWIARKYPNASDKRLYYEYVNFYHCNIPHSLREKLCSDSIPSMDTCLRRVREIREEERNRQPQMALI